MSEQAAFCMCSVWLAANKASQLEALLRAIVEWQTYGSGPVARMIEAVSVS